MAIRIDQRARMISATPPVLLVDFIVPEAIHAKTMEVALAILRAKQEVD